METEPLILLHGWGMNSRVFEPLLQVLDHRDACVNCGLPGYAGASWTFEQSFEAQLEQMGQDLPAGRLLGWSLGGLYAIELAARHPEKFNDLTLVASNPCFVRQADWDCALGAEVFDTFADELMQDWRRTLRRFLALQMQGEADARALTRDLWQQIVAAGNPDFAVLQFGLELLKQSDARETLGQLTQPVRLILGERDRLVPVALAQQIPDVAPKIQVESVAGAAHAPFLSNPKAVAGLLQKGWQGNRKI